MLLHLYVLARSVIPRLSLRGTNCRSNLEEDDIMRQLGKEGFRLFREQRGASLIETVVALAILGLIGVAFLNGLSTSSRAVMLSQENVAAESLAKSQVEYIKAQDYIPVAKYGIGTPPKLYEEIAIPDDLVSQYDIEIKPPVTIISPDTGPFELQRITVVVKRNGEGIFTMSMYRCGSTT